jgi:hypothetical protein
MNWTSFVRRGFAQSLLLLVFSGTMAVFGQPVGPSQELAASIAGTVIDGSSSLPLPTVEVHLFQHETADGVDAEVPFIAGTDSMGHFALEGLAPGRYLLTARRAGYVSGFYGQIGRSKEGSTIVVRPGEHLKNIDVTLWRTGVITGRVIGEEGNPLEGASVQACEFHFRGGKRQRVIMAQTTTNDLGEFRLYGLQTGRYFVNAVVAPSVPNRREKNPIERQYVGTMYPNATTEGQAVRVDVAPGSEVSGIDIVMSRVRTYHIRGTMIGGSGPARFGRVELSPERTSGDLARQSVDRETDNAGHFDIPAVVPGWYILSGAVNQQAHPYSGWRRVHVEDSNLDDTSLQLGPGIDLRGRIIIQSGQTVDLRNITVNLEPAHLGTTTAPSTHVDRDGRITIPSVAPDEYELWLGGLPRNMYLKSIELNGRADSSFMVDLTSASDNNNNVNIVVSDEAGQVEGVVRDGVDLNARGVRVVLVPDLSQRRHALFVTAISDQMGHFVLQGITPGKYSLFAWGGLDPEDWEDPEFLLGYEDRGLRLNIEKGSRLTQDIRVTSLQ